MPDLPNLQGSFTPPSQLDEFQVERPLGRGANGQVYLARDTVLDRPVALKFLSGRRLSRHARRRFLVEARAIARLKHPNVVTVYRFGEFRGRPYLVSEYVSGHTLARLIKPVPWQRALEIGAELAKGLAAAHEQGVLHRDIKPGNVMMSDASEVKLLDFGLAKLSGLLVEPDWAIHASSSGEEVVAVQPKDDAFQPTLEAKEAPKAITPSDELPSMTLPAQHVDKPAQDRPRRAEPTRAEPTQPSKHEPLLEPLTRAGTVLGTPAYMAPEAWQGRPATAAADVYSLGALLYELCTGKPPHYSSQVSEIEHGAIYKDIPPLSQVIPGIDGAFASIVDQCLRRNPTDRPQSGSEVRQALDTLLRPSLSSLMRKALRQYWPLVLLAGLLFIAGSASSSYFLAQRALRQQESPVLTTRKVVAVLGLAAEQNQQSNAWYATAMAELLSREMALGERVRVVATRSVQQMIHESQLREASLFDPGTLQVVRKRLEADVVIGGSYLFRSDNKRRLQLSVVAQDTLSGQILARSVVDGSDSEVFAMVAQAAQHIRQQLGVGDGMTVRRTGLRVANADTLQTYGEALRELRGFRLRNAGELLSRVVASDPDFSPAYEALATVWRELGYDVKSREVLKHAIEHTTGLQREERLLLEARYREALKDWDQAIATYQTLMRLFPDNPEYPLALGEVQRAAGKQKDALATLTQLQSEHAHAQLDPRIDAAIARALEDNGDFRAAHSRYQVAIEKSRASGALLLAARCLVSQAFVKKYQGEASTALPNLDEAQELFRRSGAQLDLADALTAKGWIYRDRGDARQAFAMFQDALSILIESGSGNGTAVHLSNFALLLLRSGDLPLASARAEASLVLAREVDYKEAAASAYLVLGWIARERGQINLVKQRITQAERIIRELDDDYLSAWLNCLLAESLVLAGELSDAKQKHELALALRSQVGSSGFVAESHIALANLALIDGRPADAIVHADKAVPLLQLDGQRDGEVWALAILSAAHAALSHKDEALGLAAKVMTLMEEIPYLSTRATVLCLLARTYGSLSLTQDMERVLDQVQHAIDDPRFAELTMRRFELRLARARLLHQLGRAAEATTALRLITQEAKQAGFLLASTEALQLLAR